MKSREAWHGWRTHALALAAQRCSLCWGLGHRLSRDGAVVICNCVLRRIFSLCMDRFSECFHGEAAVGRVNLEKCNGGWGGRASKPSTWSMKHEEYMADCCLVAFRALNDGKTREQLAEAGESTSLHWKIFTMHMLLGAEWSVCCRRLNLGRGQFFHHVYRIQALLGFAFAETQPHALFPLDEYFASTVKRA